MKQHFKFAALSVALLQAHAAFSQTVPADSNAPAKAPWAFNLTIDGFLVPDQGGYASTIFAADRGWLHLEARYNYEDLRTGSLWAGYNWSVGKKLVFSVTPMIGGVFGRTTGIAPGCEASLTYKKVELSVSNEFVFATGKEATSFYYTWPQLTYMPFDWLRIGLVAQRTRAYHTGLDTQRGFFAGFSHKKMDFTTYVFNAGWTQPTVVLEFGVGF